MKKPSNEIIRNDRVKMIYSESILWKEEGIEVFEITPYQFRFIKENHIVDYYPTSGKYFDITIQERGFCPTQQIISLFNKNN